MLGTLFRHPALKAAILFQVFTSLPAHGEETVVRVPLPECATGVEAPAAAMVASCSMALAAPALTPRQQADLLFIRGVFYLRLSQHATAAENFMQGLAIDPQNARLHRGLAIVYMHFGKQDEALSHATKAIELAPDSSTNFVILGNVHERLLNDDKAALSAYDAALKNDPNNAGAHLYRMLNLHAQERGGEAEKEGRWLVSQPPSVSKTWGNFAYQGRQMPLAISARLFFAQLLSSLRRDDEAEALLTDLVETHPTPQSFLGRADFYAAHGVHKAPRMKEAARDAAEAVRLDPSYGIGWKNLALFQRNSGDQAGALMSLSAALALKDWGDGHPRMVWEQAILLRNLSRLEEAKEGVQAAMMLAMEMGPRATDRLLHPLRKRGYWSGPAPAEINEALKDAALACLIDEGCE